MITEKSIEEILRRILGRKISDSIGRGKEKEEGERERDRVVEMCRNMEGGRVVKRKEKG